MEVCWQPEEVLCVLPSESNDPLILFRTPRHTILSFLCRSSLPSPLSYDLSRHRPPESLPDPSVFSETDPLPQNISHDLQILPHQFQTRGELLTSDIATERAITLRRDELIATKKLYETVMTFAAHGLFYRSGRLIGERVAKEIGKEVADLKAYLIEEGWVLDIDFEGDTVIAKGSIEVIDSDVPTCHMLRGILSKFFEDKIGRDVYCHERNCQSKGDEYCVFSLDAEMIK